MGRFDGRVALIVGGGGIGAAAAARLASEGSSVTVLDLDLAAAREAVDPITAFGGAARAIEGDLADEASLQDAVDLTVSQFGGLDLLLNNASHRKTKDPTFDADLDVATTPQDVWDQMFDVNVMGYVRTSRLVIPHMIERGRGAVVNMISGSGLESEPVRVAYQTSKIAVGGLTRHMAVELAAKGIRVNAVGPGLTTTPRNLALPPAQLVALAAMIPMGRLATCEEIAAIICFLLSDDASYVTGQTIVADGAFGVSAYPGDYDAGSRHYIHIADDASGAPSDNP